MADAGPLLVITGPTASGKSAVAVEVAARIGGEIISMDSRQVYRGLDIGTAKPATDEIARVPHHGIDIIDPSERYSAGQFARDARRWIEDIRARGRVPVVAGGTLFFLRALQQPLFDEPPMDTDRREQLRSWLAARPAPVLAQWAAHVSPPGTTLPADPQRLARLIEVATLTGRSLSWWHDASPPSPALDVRIFVISLDRDELYRRIDARVDEMVEKGLPAEVQGLVARGYGRQHPGMKTTGYVELLPFLEGTASLQDAITAIQATTRQYARRQLTWIRTQLRGDVTELDGATGTDAMAGQVVQRWKQGQG